MKKGYRINVPNIEKKLREKELTKQDVSIKAGMSKDSLAKSMQRGVLTRKNGENVRKALGMQNHTFWIQEEPEEAPKQEETPKPETVIWVSKDQKLDTLLRTIADALNEYLEPVPTTPHQMTLDEYEVRQ